MGKIIISKAKFLKDRCLIEYTEQRGGNIQPSKISEERTDSPHTDLKQQFKKLSLHAAALAEFIPTSEITDLENFSHPDLERFHVTGLSISGEDRDQVVLTGQKQLKTGKVLTFNTPVCRLTDIGEKAYVFNEELELAVAKALEEVKEYLNGKTGDDSQQKIPFPNDEEKVTHLQVLPPIIPLVKPEAPVQFTETVEDFTETQESSVPVELEDGTVISIPVAKGSGKKKKPQSQDNPKGE